jgi:nitrogen fixation protein NifB
MHLGEAERLEIFRCGPEGVERLESRAVPAPGGGTGRWEALAEIISDCSLLLVSGAGESPKRVLSERGIEVRELEGLIQDALAAISAGKDLKPMARKAAFACGASCSGNGGGCG